MSKFEVLTIIAAFGGLILSVVNTGILIFKEYFIKAILEVEVEKAYIREISEGLYDIQINFICNSSHGDIYFKDSKLVSPEKVFGSCADMATDIYIYRMLELSVNNLIKCGETEYLDEIKKLFDKDSQQLIRVRDFKFDKNSQRSFTITDRIETSRWPDGWESLSFENWKFVIYHNKGISECTFDFEGEIRR